MADLEKLVDYQSQALTETEHEIERMYYIIRLPDLSININYLCNFTLRFVP